MKLKRSILGFVASLLIPVVALADFSNADKQFFPAKNLLLNPGFEQGKTKWGVESPAGSFSINTTAAHVANGAASASFTGASNGQQFGASLVTIPAGLYGRDCLAQVMYKGGDSNLRLKVEDGSGSSLASIALSTQATYKKQSLGFPCPTSGSFRPVIRSTASAAQVYLDDFYIGEDYGSSLYSVSRTNWYVDAYIQGANPTLGTSAVTSYTGIENSGLTISAVSGSLSVQIPCSSTNASSGATCSAGNESVGVVYTQPTAGPVEACVTTGHNIDVATSSNLSATFQVVETPNTAQTVSTEGNDRVISGLAVGTGASSSTATHPIRICGLFNFATAGQKTIRLFYEQSVAGTPGSSILYGDADSNNGQRHIHWTVRPLYNP